jgi:cell wall-associated NlpC family hydrolase
VPLNSVPRAVEPSPQEAAPAPSDPGTEAERAVAAARTVLGRPYQWGATGPDTFDCSGLTQWAYRQAGVEIPRVSRAQWYSGPRVALADLAVGDLLFWAEDTSDPTSIYHVGMYIGGAEVLYAPRTGDVVKIGPVRLNNLIGAVRPAPSQISGRRAA